MEPLKISEALAKDIQARIKAFDFGTIEKIKKAEKDNGTFDVIISTEDVDRAGEIVRQDGWDLTNYKNNPIVLWGHDYYSLPIGVCTETYITESHGVKALGAKGVFFPAEVNPLAQQVRRMYDYGIKMGIGAGCTTSVGFIPKDFDGDNRNIITKAELLEFSFVPVPANQGVGPAKRSLTFAEARTLQLDVTGMRQKGLSFADTVGYIPKSLNDDIAAENTTWKKPTLKDFTDKKWEELTETEVKEITGHFAYAKNYPPQAFEDLKLAYRNSEGKIVLRGLKSAVQSLVGIRSGMEVEDDKKPVYDHLAKLYSLFGKEAPEFKTLKEAQAGDTCEMDDGSAGTLQADPDDADGPLVCAPGDTKSAKDEHGSQKELLKAVGDEHDRHTDEIEKCMDSYAGEKSFKDLRASVNDEQTMHRAKSVANFKDFKPGDEKAFDKNEHLKALRNEHDTYEAKCEKALDEHEDAVTKAQDTEGANQALSEKLQSNARSHKRAVNKIAKSMSKAAFGEDEEPDEKTVEIIKEFLAPHVDAQLLTPLTVKIASKLTGEYTKKLSEAHQHLKAATAVLETLSKALGDGSGEIEPAVVEAPAIRRSNPVKVAPVKEDGLDAHLFARDLLRGITTAATDGLKNINEEIRKGRSNK
jgi:hypothetical protein